MFSAKTTRRNLEKAWDMVSQDDIEIGEASYPSYHAAIKLWSEFYEIDFIRCVEAFAALSPNNDYHGNLRSLSSVLFSAAAGVPFEELTISTYRACGFRAMSYVNGTVSFVDTVKGPKITAFRHNIAFPKTSDRVTVDGHMVAIWADKPDFTMKNSASLLTNKLYFQAEDDIRKFAKKLGVIPSTVQATMWISRKRRSGIKFSSQKNLFSGQTGWDETLRPQDYPPFQIKPWLQWARKKGKLDV